MKIYKHLFFDLDHTLWDHETNAQLTLAEAYHHFQLGNLGMSSATAFQQTFSRINPLLWTQYERNQISSEQLRQSRFRLIFSALDVTDHSLCDEVSEFFLAVCPQKSNLMPSAMEVLTYLAPKYPMHLITNGFNEIQGTKMASGGITHFFQEVITSHRAGEKKPHRQIFDFALQTINAQPKDCLMIGDNPEADIMGALQASIDAVWYNPEGQTYEVQPTHEIKDLKELMEIL